MPSFKSARTNSRSSSNRPESLIKRTLSGTLAPDLHSKRVTTNSRPSPTASQSSTFQRTPSGTPAPIPPRTIDILPQPQEDVDDDTYDHRILAFDKTNRNTVGCSYYVARDGVLYCMEDVKGADKDIFDILKIDVQPTVVLLSPRIDTSKQESASSTHLELDDSENSSSAYTVELRPSNDFKYESAVHKLSSISTLELPGVKFLVPGDEEDLNQDQSANTLGLTQGKGRTLHISGDVNLESHVSVGCAGAIVTYLAKKKASKYLHGDPAAEEAFQILRFEVSSLSNTMLVNQDTIAALQILQPESHPSAAKQGPGSSGAKESLSIYGLFHFFAKTPQGRQQLRNMFLRPSTDFNVIKARHDSVAVLANSSNQELRQRLSKSLTKIKNMSRIMVMLHKGVISGSSKVKSFKSGVWSSLLDFCFHIIDVAETLNQIVGVEQIFLWQKICTAFDRLEFQRLGKIIWDVVDLQESEEQHRTVVKRGVDLELDQVKDAYDSMDEMLCRVARETISELPRMDQLPKLTVTYIPQLGFLIVIPPEDSDHLMLVGLNQDWERRFVTDRGTYFKNNKMREMDADLGDLWAHICDTEIDISHDLGQYVLEKEAFVVEASELCGQLDALLALANGACRHKLVRPRIVGDNVIDIRGGRHLLQEMTVPSYVPNDAFLVGGSGNEDVAVEQQSAQSPTHPSLLLVTGPNYSGKSVYLKQVALIVYMAHVGSFVPVDYACLGITDRILTRITTRETVSKGQSTFMIDLQQMAYALNSFTARSLLIIDEFGKGTDNCDGAGLCAGVLTHLLSLGRQAPKVLASTHFHEIFEQSLLSEDLPGLGLRQMEVQVRPKLKTDQRATQQAHRTEVTYLYNVRPGRSTLSYGAQCAAMNGVPAPVVDRACQLTELALTGENLVSVCAYVPDEELDDLRDAEAVNKAFIAMELDDMGDSENIRGLLEELLGNASSTYATITNRSTNEESFTETAS